MSSTMTFREQVTWAAGLIEGEGCFTLHSKNHPYFLLDMCDKDVLERFKEVFPYTNLRGPYFHKKRPENKPRYRVDAFGPKAYAIMVAVYPFLHSRRKAKIEELLVLYKQFPDDNLY